MPVDWVDDRDSRVDVVATAIEDLRGVWRLLGGEQRIALAVTAVANTAANRRLTFGVRGPDRLLRDDAGGLVAFGVALLLTTASIFGLDRLLPGASRTAEIALLTAANAIATGVRFLMLRTLLYHLRNNNRRTPR